MTVVVNGEPKALSDGVTVAQVLERLAIQPERVVVEVNLTVLKRAQLATTALQDGDHVEIVHFVGGGQADTSGQTQDARTKDLVSRVLYRES